MSDPSNIYHTSAVPSIMYYCGNEIIGGGVRDIDQVDPDLCYYYDFRETWNYQSLGDANSDELKLNKALNSRFTRNPEHNKWTRSENGASLAPSDRAGAYIKIPVPYYIPNYDSVIEFETGVAEPSETQATSYLLTFCWNNGNYGVIGYIGSNSSEETKNVWYHSSMQSTLNWGEGAVSQPWKDSQGNNITDRSIFSNSIIKIKTSPFNDQGVRIYKNGNLLTSDPGTCLRFSNNSYLIDMFPANKGEYYYVSFGNIGSKNSSDIVTPYVVKWAKVYYERIPNS